MLNDLPPAASGRRAAWLPLVLLPFLLSACITITDQGAADTTPSPSPSPTLDPFATPTAVPLASPTPTPTPVPTPEPVDAAVLGFMPGFLIEDASEAMDTSLLTTLALHGVEASGDGRLVAKKPNGDVPPGWEALESDAFADLRDRLQADGVDVVVNIQRFGWTDGSIKRTRNLLGSKKVRQRLATRIAKLVSDRGLDGAVLDFEPMPEDLTDRFSAFVREVRAALDEVDPDLHLSVAVVSDLAGYDLAALTADDAADAVVIMGYEYRGAGARIASSIAPLVDAATGDLTRSVSEALAQAPADKIILALPWYGRAWSTETDEPGSRTVSGRGIEPSATVTYATAVELAAESGRNYDPTSATAWTAYPKRQCPTCDATWRQLWYDDPESFATKIDLAVERNLAGVGIWALGHEAGRSEMWTALRSRLRPQLDDAPPNGQAPLDRAAVLGDREDLDVVEGSAPLRLFASDGTGTGTLLARIGLSGEVDEEGRLVTGRDYPAVERITFPLGDPETGGSSESGPRSIYVQWRDLAGNWSTPLVVDVWVEDPATLPTPQDAG